MRLLELQRQLTLRLNRFSRSMCMALTVATFYAAAFLLIQAAAPDVNPAAVPDGQPETETAAVKTKTQDDSNPRYRPTDDEIKLLARAVYSEARGEQYTGQVAVAAVILNRIDDPDFPDDVAGVIFQPQAFTAVADGQFWLEPNEQSYRAVEEALQGSDPSTGAIYYYNPATATSWWIFTRQTITRIGRHVFAV